MIQAKDLLQLKRNHLKKTNNGNLFLHFQCSLKTMQCIRAASIWCIRQRKLIGVTVKINISGAITPWLSEINIVHFYHNMFQPSQVY